MDHVEFGDEMEILYMDELDYLEEYIYYDRTDDPYGYGSLYELGCELSKKIKQEEIENS